MDSFPEFLSPCLALEQLHDPSSLSEVCLVGENHVQLRFVDFPAEGIGERLFAHLQVELIGKDVSVHLEFQLFTEFSHVLFGCLVSSEVSQRGVYFVHAQMESLQFVHSFWGESLILEVDLDFL